MRFLDLPKKLFELILHQAILVRGLKRGLRLRLGYFDQEIIRALHTFRLFDEMAFRRTAFYSSESIHFFDSYLEYRIMNESVKGNRFLNNVRNVALQIATLNDVREADQRIVHDVVRTLCATRTGLSIRFRWRDEFRRALKWESDVLEKQLFGAALCTNTLSFIRRSDTLRNNMLSGPTSSHNSCVFGEYIELAAKHGNEELLEYLLTSEASGNSSKLRSELFRFAAKAGRIDIIRFLYTFRSEEWSWPCEGDARARECYLDTILRETYNPQVWDFIEPLRISHGLPPAVASMVDDKLDMCTRLSLLDMATLLVRVGAYAEGGRHRFSMKIHNSAVKIASIRGCVALVELLLDNGEDSSHTLVSAVAYGRVKLVRTLLDRGIKTSDALVKVGTTSSKPTQLLANAERRPYLDVVRLLLDAGVDVNESIRKESPLAGAVAAEHTALFNFLLERGANLHSPGTAEECVRRARQDGLESMLSLLEQHGVDVKDHSGQAV